MSNIASSMWICIGTIEKVQSRKISQSDTNQDEWN